MGPWYNDDEKGSSTRIVGGRGIDTMIILLDMNGNGSK